MKVTVECVPHGAGTVLYVPMMDGWMCTSRERLHKNRTTAKAKYACPYRAKLPRWTQKECTPGAPHGPIHKQEIGKEIHKPRGLNGSTVALSWIHVAGSKLNNSGHVCCACLVYYTRTHQQYSDGHQSCSARGNSSIQKQHMAGGNVWWQPKIV